MVRERERARSTGDWHDINRPGRRGYGVEAARRISSGAARAGPTASDVFEIWELARRSRRPGWHRWGRLERLITDALERIAGVLDAPNSGEVWLTAAPGCEFEVSGGKAHAGGGSHGALHELDSLSPVIIAGAGAPPLPRHMRSVDIAPLCMDLLGLSMQYRVGDGRG